MYIPVKSKFLISFALSALWVVFSLWISQDWYSDLKELIPGWFAAFIVLSIAILPGFMTSFFTASLWLDKCPLTKDVHHQSPVTVLISSYNEEENISNTLDSIHPTMKDEWN